MTIFFAVLDPPNDEKPEALLRAVQQIRGVRAWADQATVFERVPNSFVNVPGSPFAYWVSDEIRDIFSNHAVFETSRRSVLGGLKTLSDDRFVRVSWESAEHSPLWVPLAKGGAFSKFYSDVHLCVNWGAKGTDISWYGYQRRPREGFGASSRGVDSYFRPGLTWPRRTQGGLGIRVMPRGCIFADKGPAAFVEGDNTDELLALVAISNSVVFRYLVGIQMAFGSYEVGVIQRTPVPNLSDEDAALLGRLGRRAWSLQRSLDTANETSHAFVLPPGLNEWGTALTRVAAERELATIQSEIDEAAYRLYGILTEDRAAIERSSRGASAASTIRSEDIDGGDEASEDEATVGVATDGFNSWLVGCAFGRFDPRLATGERPLPPEPKPFDPLPLRSPGMWPEGEEPSRRPDILFDDEGHLDDLVALMREVSQRVGVDAPENLRSWLAKDFFALHIKMYSKSRRKAPIYWQLSTPSASFSVWLYIHAFSKDTFFRVQDYVERKFAEEERRHESLLKELAVTGTAARRRKLAAQETLVEELRTLLEEVKRVAPIWNPNLDDGVIINFAPLGRLVPQNKSWHKELKATWDSLCAGDYEWTHLAMHLWPERVVPKCASDRSLAIAHGLEEVLWIEGADGKWKPRETPTSPISALIAERSSEAVKAALKSLLEAPEPFGSTKRGRKSKAA